MRLLNTEALELELFVAESKPEYAILSHTWGPEEVLFEDARHGKDRLQRCGKRALDKVLKSAALASQDGYKYIWIDTCCIDKSSSAELSEAINSMFAWYQRSAVCYAFLSDYTHDAQGGTLSDSRWFTRGWTLQELIAPSKVRFFDSAWTPFGDRRSLSSHIATITKIDKGILERHFACGSHQVFISSRASHSQQSCQACSDKATIMTDKSLKSYSISARMSWAARRETTRVEDIAYCLLGIFDVAMPLLYGEGLKAFRRLQAEIVRHSNDQTFLTWDIGKYGVRMRDASKLCTNAVFAPHPVCFSNGHLFRPIPALLSEFTTMVRDGGGGAIELDVHLAPCTLKSQAGTVGCRPNTYLAALNCSQVHDDFGCVCILLEQLNPASHSFRRLWRAETHDGDPIDDCIYPLVVSPARSACIALGTIGIPVRVEFSLTEMTKSRILLHETKDRWPGENPTPPRVCFTFPRGLMPGYRLRRQVPDPGSLPMWEWTGLPTRYPMSQYMARRVDSIERRPPPSPPYIYGAASFSDGGCGFSVMWGSLDQIAMEDADGHYQTLFCKVCQNLDGTPWEADRLTTSNWLRRLIAAAIRQDERDALSAKAILEPLGVFSSLTWTSDAGSSVCVEATIRAATFLGRKRFEVEVVMKGGSL